MRAACRRRLAGLLAPLSLAAAFACGGAPDAPPRWVDWAGEAHRQTVVDREPGQHLGHPATVPLADQGSILAVYPKGHGRGPIVIQRSGDGGLTWSGRLPTPASWATSLETPTVFPVDLADGRRRLLLFSGNYPMRMARSEDDGRTWTELQPIGHFGGIAAMSSVARLRSVDGELIALFHHDARFLHQPMPRDARSSGAPEFKVYKTISLDDGATWSAPEAIASHPEAQLGDPGLVRSPDGREIAVLLSENSRRFNSFVVFSRDEGRTWSRPVELPSSLAGDRHIGRYTPDGRLFVTFRDQSPSSPWRGDWVGWLGRYEDLKRGVRGRGEQAHEEQAVGDARVRLMDNVYAADTGRPDLELLPDGTFVATASGHFTAGEASFPVSVRFTTAELDAAAAEAPVEPPPKWFGQDRDEIDHLLDLTARRLAFMPAVAAWKAEQGAAIEDVERERRVLDAAEASALEFGLDPLPVRDWVALQIDLAKAVQRRSAGAPRTLELDQIRPVLIRLARCQVQAVRAAVAHPVPPPEPADFLVLSPLLNEREVERVRSGLLRLLRETGALRTP